MAAFPQPAIRIQAAPLLPAGPFLRTSHPSFPLHFPPPYFPVPAGWDPSVSLAHPYIYDPTQVKHRRRTTPEQLKILEDTFKTDPKPNAALRKQLSLEIGMTPRVLQVWFQNRRMKVKREAKKFKIAARQRASAEPEPAHNADPSPPQTPPTTDNNDSPRSPPDSTPSRSSTPATEGAAARAPPDAVRRGSLPAALDAAAFSLAPAPAQPRPPASPFDAAPDAAVYRRRSMTSLQRLDAHPFAPLVAATNGLAPAHTVVPPTPPAFSPHRPTFPHHHHSPSTPVHVPPTRLQPPPRSASFHVLPHPQHLHAFHPHLDAQPFAFPPRPLQPPIPGPLPAADYSFGTPPVQNAAPEEVDVRPYIPSVGTGAFSVRAAAAAAAGVAVPRFGPPRDDDTDTEYSSSRFGSIASDTSASASASVSGASAWGDDDRRGSWTGHVADMLSGLDMGGGRKAADNMWADQWARGGSAENLSYPQDALERENQRAYEDVQRAYDAQADRDGQAYARAAQDTPPVPISLTSELAYALCGSGGGASAGKEHAMAGYAGRPNVTDEYSLGTLADSAPYTLY